MQVFMKPIAGTNNIAPKSLNDVAVLTSAGAFNGNGDSTQRRQADWAEFARRNGIAMYLYLSEGIRSRID